MLMGTPFTSDSNAEGFRRAESEPPPFDWASDPGVDGRIRDSLPASVIRVDQIAGFPAEPDDGLDDTAAFREALQQAKAGGAIVLAPAGEWIISETLRLQGDDIVLRGVGSDATTILFKNRPDGTFGLFGPEGPGIEILSPIGCCGNEDDSESRLVISGTTGTRELRVESHPSFSPGSYGWLNYVGSGSDDDAGQMVRIEAIADLGDEVILTLDQQLGLDYGTEFGFESRLRPVPLVERNGVYGLALRPENDDVLLTDTFLLKGTSNAWLFDVVSTRAKYSHVTAQQSYRCEIANSLFDDASLHGNGKQGYGVNLANQTSGCLVTGNSFRLLRHSILLNNGATGNVVALNHSRDPRHPNFPTGGPDDISFHEFSVANLVEGNVIEKIEMNDAAIAGPHNTLIRNCLTSGPLTLDNGANNAYIGGNAMFGTLERLQEPDRMPEFTDAGGTYPAQPYYTGDDDIFEDFGIWVKNEGAGNTKVANWHVPTDGVPGGLDTVPNTLWGASRTVLESPIGDLYADCGIPALRRLGRLDLERRGHSARNLGQSGDRDDLKGSQSRDRKEDVITIPLPAPFTAPLHEKTRHPHRNGFSRMEADSPPSARPR